MENFVHLGSRNMHSTFHGKQPTRFLMCEGKLGPKGQEFSENYTPSQYFNQIS